MRFSSLNPFKKNSSKFAGLAAALMILPVAVACDTQSANVATDPAPDTTAEVPTTEAPMADSATTGETIVDVAAADGSFTTLVAAVQSAGLADTLSSEGPYTVFAPTDEAFAALPAGTVDRLLLPENQEILTQILTYHVVAGEVPSSDVETGTVATVEGSDLDVVADQGGVTVNNATVIQPDVVASNGVIHVIDSVLLPPTLDLSTL